MNQIILQTSNFWKVYYNNWNVYKDSNSYKSIYTYEVQWSFGSVEEMGPFLSF